jgi:hypothetical protein
MARPKLGGDEESLRFTITLSRSESLEAERIMKTKRLPSKAAALRWALSNINELELLLDVIDVKELNFFQEYVGLLGKSSVRDILLGLKKSREK